MIGAYLIFAFIATVLRVSVSQTTYDIASFDLRNISYWRGLAPNLHVNDAEFLHQQGIYPDESVNKSYIHDQILHEGYAQLNSLSWQLPLDDMVALIDTLHSRHIPITFCFMYDEFWFIFMHLHPTLQHILGSEYQRLPDFWAWRVDPDQSERGWHVHRDKGHETLYSNGMPKSLTVWIPLTDATTDNGCMYVLPADRDPTYRTDQLVFPYFRQVAGDIRALPIQAGKILLHSNRSATLSAARLIFLLPCRLLTRPDFTISSFLFPVKAVR
jgi:hypothetical protein